MTASISGGCTIKNTVTISANNLGLTYDSTSSTAAFGIFGSATVSVGSGKTLQSISASFGAASNPGIVLGSTGELASFLVHLNGNFNLGGVTVAPTNLTLGDNPTHVDANNNPDPEFTIGGGLAVDLTVTVPADSGSIQFVISDASVGPNYSADPIRFSGILFIANCMIANRKFLCDLTLQSAIGDLQCQKILGLVSMTILVPWVPLTSLRRASRATPPLSRRHPVAAVSSTGSRTTPLIKATSWSRS